MPDKDQADGLMSKEQATDALMGMMPQALRVVERLLDVDDKSIPWGERSKAARAVIEHNLGRPTVRIEQETPPKWSDEELERMRQESLRYRPLTAEQAAALEQLEGRKDDLNGS